MTKVGRIKWFNNEKGYGFIEGENDEDIFVHYTAIKQDGYKSLSEGQIVEYELLETEKGLQAINGTAQFGAAIATLVQFVGTIL